jgi:CheY-like chemotaxis protein
MTKGEKLKAELNSVYLPAPAAHALRMCAQKFRVLVADDSPDDQFFAQRAFKRAFTLEQCGAVHDGVEVKEYLMGGGQYADRNRFPFPDLILLDIEMPRQDGLETLAWIQQQHFPSLRIVMLSGSLDAKNIARALELGADYYQAKMSDADLLIRRLESLMVLFEQRDARKRER